PAMDEARKGPSAAEAAASPSFHHFQQEVQQLAAQPTGVGLDVPLWLRRIEVEIQTVKNKESPLAAQVEQQVRVPQKLFTFQEFQQQVQDWETPLLPP
ncbi:MAG TPA: hypothetical protein VGY77_02200, partial [Gemmataceae bacterium]|nr:hypothetical protein [Gemmataceae bacterium]